MTRDDVCQEFGAWYRGKVPEEVHWSAAEAMADEIVRLRRILDALREPSEAMVKAVDAALVYAPTRADVFRELIRRAVEAAEQEVNP